MKKRIFALMLIMLFFVACSESYELDGESYELGSVVLIADGIEHEPYIHFLHAMYYLEAGLVSASDHPAEFWLAENANRMHGIPYAEDLQILIEGTYGRVNTNARSPLPLDYNGMEIIAIPSGNFTAGRANIFLPNEAGTYLVYVDVLWSGGGSEFTATRYFFKIIK